MARRQLLTEGERRQLFGVPADPDALVRHYTLSRSDLGFDCVRQAGVNWEAVISTVGQVGVSAARVASSLAAMPVIVSSVR